MKRPWRAQTSDLLHEKSMEYFPVALPALFLLGCPFPPRLGRLAPLVLLRLWLCVASERRPIFSLLLFNLFFHFPAPPPLFPPFFIRFLARTPSTGEAREQAIFGGVAGRCCRGDALRFFSGDLRQVADRLRRPRVF